MDTPHTIEQNSIDEQLARGRVATKQIIILLTFTFLSLIVSLFMGMSVNLPSAISSLLLILAFSRLGKYNPSESSDKVYWWCYAIAAVMFLAAFRSFMNSYIIFDDQFGQALNCIAYGAYFVYFRPSKSGFSSKVLKVLGYLLLTFSINLSYSSSADWIDEIVICICMFLGGTVLLYFANADFLRKVFNR